VFLFYTVCFLERGIVSISLLIDAHQGLKLTGASGKNANKMTKMPPKLELCGENKPQLGFFYACITICKITRVYKKHCCHNLLIVRFNTSK